MNCRYGQPLLLILPILYYYKLCEYSYMFPHFNILPICVHIYTVIKTTIQIRIHIHPYLQTTYPNQHFLWIWMQILQIKPHPFAPLYVSLSHSQRPGHHRLLCLAGISVHASLNCRSNVLREMVRKQISYLKWAGCVFHSFRIWNGVDVRN